MLYLHIPLCGSKCHYCDFYSVAARGVDRSAIVRAMIDEIDRRSGEIDQPSPTIYFGGGTPSLLSIDEIDSLIVAARRSFPIVPHCSMTIEANPEQLNERYLEGLLSVGINRLSIGVQSLRDDRLAALGRRHSAAQAIDAVREARKVGFDDISIDLMFGFSDMDLAEWGEQLDRAFTLGVDHLSAYQLSIEPRTVFARRGVQCAADDQAAEQYALLRQTARQAGFDHYEISNFALPHHQSIHNSGYWTGQPYVGIGAAAHSFDGARRRSWNIDSVRDYIAGTPAEGEDLTDTDLHNEFVMTRLRTSSGFSIDDYQRRFNRSIRPTVGLTISGDRATIEPHNWFVADAIIANLFL